MKIQMIKHKPLIAGIITAILLIIVLIYKFDLAMIFVDAEKTKAFVQGFGIWGPAVLVLLVCIAVVIFIFPSLVLVVASGYLYGPFVATVCCIIGLMIGSCILFYLSKRYGRKFVENHVHKKDLQHFDIFFKKNGTVALFLSRLTPLMPNDMVNLASGLTDISFRDFFIATFVGYIPETIIYTMLGEQLLTGKVNPGLLFLSAIIIIFFIIYLFRHKLRVFLIKEVREFEETVKKEENIIFKDIKKLEKKMDNVEKRVIKKISKKS
ncbi:MAG: TVP38/TMEM64 family protein [Nanoarchaeota archaeon]